MYILWSLVMLPNAQQSFFRHHLSELSRREAGWYIASFFFRPRITKAGEEAVLLPIQRTTRRGTVARQPGPGPGPRVRVGPASGGAHYGLRKNEHPDFEQTADATERRGSSARCARGFQVGVE